LPTIYATDRAGEVNVVPARPGESLMQSLRQQDLEIAAICGGCRSCATCHVYVDPQWISRTGEAAAEETELLEGSVHYKPGTSRLSCQIVVTDELDGLKITVAPED
jgi:2Fe-2S ferredoxin